MQKITASEAFDMLNTINALLVDVREGMEYFDKRCRIENLKHIPFRQIDETDLNIPPQTPIIVVCTLGLHGEEAATKLQAKGYANTYYIEGGILAWQAAQLPMFSLEEEIEKNLQCHCSKEKSK